ncbi:MAG: hypothetical protein LBJ14_07605 [Desulfarculales bacterium]|jgi:hypothetical protein|nr:hypothetical protein [Desulfarculales bacterium]
MRAAFFAGQHGWGRTSGLGWRPVLFSLLFMSFFLLSPVFTISHADHDCSGEQCPVCAQINSAQQMSKQMAPAGGHFFTAVSAPAFFMSVLAMAGTVFCLTPVTLKIRMNN